VAEVASLVRRHNIRDESLMSVPEENCNLHLRIADQSFSYCIYNRERNKFIALTESRFPGDIRPDELQSLMLQDELLNNRRYHRISISCYSDESCLVPAAAFREADAEKYLALTIRRASDGIVLYDKLKYTDACNIYSIEKNLYDMLNLQFSHPVYLHTGTVLMESELLRNKNNPDHSISVHIRQRTFDIIVTFGGKLILYNSFRYQSSEDVLYFILFVMEQLKLNPEKASLQLSGDTDKHMTNYILSAKYIRNITFAQRPESFKFSYGFEHLQDHAAYDLFNQQLCVS
jgi:hypothetical protein